MFDQPLTRSPSLTWLARAGQLAKGVIFGSMGLLSTLAALHGNGAAQDSRGALRSIVQQPFGRVLLIAIIGGLVCYVVWRVLAAVLDLEDKGQSAKGLAQRARMLFSAAIYSGLTLAALNILRGATRTGGGSDQAARDWTARALGTPSGKWIVVLVGMSLVIGGVVICYRAWRRKFERKLDLRALSADAREWLTRVCVFGLGARGVVFAIIGIFLVQAGWHSNPRAARGLVGALNAIQAQTHGRVLFGIVAAGLAAYGVYCCIRARYGRWGSA